jgi:hypothetical protein
MQSMFGDAVGEGTEIKFKVVKLEVGDALTCRYHPPAPLFELSAVWRRPTVGWKRFTLRSKMCS